MVDNKHISAVVEAAKNLYETTATAVREQGLAVPPWPEADGADVQKSMLVALTMLDLADQIVETAKARTGIEQLRAAREALSR